MRTTIISEGPEFRIESTGNGWGYTVTHKPTGKSVWLQDQDASNFRCDLGMAELAFPTYSSDQIAFHLWSDHEYCSLAKHMPVVPWGPYCRTATRRTFVPWGTVEALL